MWVVMVLVLFSGCSSDERLDLSAGVLYLLLRLRLVALLGGVARLQQHRHEVVSGVTVCVLLIPPDIRIVMRFKSSNI